MTAYKQHEPANPVIKAPAPQRPKTLLQRLSSGLTHALPSFRASTPKNDLIIRPTTAPSPNGKRTRRRAIVAESEQLLVPQLEATTIGGPQLPCPYDPNSYHPFASIEKRRCSFCGMRGPKIVQNEPCYACRMGGAGSHISGSHKQAHDYRRHSAVDARHLAHLADSSSSVLLGPRPVTPERAAKRIGNPPRVSRLPPGIIRLPAVNTVSASQNTTAGPPSRLGATSPNGRRINGHPQSSSSIEKEETPKKPASPKLHRIHGLSNSENFPYVHRHEIPKHAVALRAGSASPLTDQSNSPRSCTDVCAPSDFSNTVYYGGKRSHVSVSRAATPKPRVTTLLVERLQTSGSAIIDLQASPLDVALDNSRVYRKRSPQQTWPSQSPQALGDATDSGTTFGSQDTASTKIGGMRLELKGGSPFGGGGPRLRGGSGHGGLPTNTFSFKLKRWLLTCHGPCRDDLDTDSDADLPPARVVSPQRVARMQQKMNGKAALPAHISKQPPITSPIRSLPPSTVDISPATTFTTTIEGPPKRTSSFRLSNFDLPAFFHRQPESPISQSAPLSPSQILEPPCLKLRGGAEPSKKIPPTLFWLAGGTGKSISLSDWKQSRPKQRMSGLFGMAVFGRKYGEEYGHGISQGDVMVSCSASVKVAVNDGGSVKSAKGSNNASSSSSSAADPAKDVTANANDAAPVGGAECVHRALTPPRPEPVDEVPLCSGALPVNPPMDLPADSSAHTRSSHVGEGKADDVAAGAPQNGNA